MKDQVIHYTTSPEMFARLMNWSGIVFESKCDVTDGVCILHNPPVSNFLEEALVMGVAMGKVERHDTIH